jgi:hypothetical protein
MRNAMQRAFIQRGGYYFDVSLMHTPLCVGNNPNSLYATSTFFYCFLFCTNEVIVTDTLQRGPK